MYFKKLVLHNYRSYNHQEIDFTLGLNAVIGSGGNGKSNILKALQFVLFNTQNGNVIANDIKDDSGKIKKGESCWVELHLDTGDVIRRERGRSSADNFYTINGGNKIGAGTSVPEDVSKILNMGDVNVQGQFETHFMLNENSSTVAKTLNKMVDLEIIDESVSNINKIVRAIKKDKDGSDSNVKKYTTDLEKYTFIEQMEKDVNELITLETSESKLADRHDTLLDHLEAIQEITDTLSTITDITSHSSLVDALMALYSAMEDVDTDKDHLAHTLDNIERLAEDLIDMQTIGGMENLSKSLLELLHSKEDKVKSFNQLVDCSERIEALEKSHTSFTDLDKYQGLVADILTLYEKCDKVVIDKERLLSTLEDIESLEKSSDEISKVIVDNLENIRGQNCPTCGQEIKEEVC